MQESIDSLKLRQGMCDVQVWTLTCCRHVFKSNVPAFAVLCCQVRKLMTVMEDSQQQQQQRDQAGSSSSSSNRNGSWATQLLLYRKLLEIISTTSLVSTTAAVRATWRDLGQTNSRNAGAHDACAAVTTDRS
jgi:hypothetical protein